MSFDKTEYGQHYKMVIVNTCAGSSQWKAYQSVDIRPIVKEVQQRREARFVTRADSRV
jgi:hypothetical protein